MPFITQVALPIEFDASFWTIPNLIELCFVLLAIFFAQKSIKNCVQKTETRQTSAHTMSFWQKHNSSPYDNLQNLQEKIRQYFRDACSSLAQPILDNLPLIFQEIFEFDRPTNQGYICIQFEGSPFGWVYRPKSNNFNTNWYGIEQQQYHNRFICIQNEDRTTFMGPSFASRMKITPLSWDLHSGCEWVISGTLKIFKNSQIY